MTDREKEIKKLAKEISIRVRKLAKLDCYYSDSASDILLFDDTLTDLQPENRNIGDLKNGV